MADIWKKACAKVGEDIDMYSGLKHSSCSQYINEAESGMDEVQLMTDHARRDSVKRYALFSLRLKGDFWKGSREEACDSWALPCNVLESKSLKSNA